MAHVMLFPISLFCTIMLVLSEVCVQCPIRLYYYYYYYYLLSPLCKVITNIPGIPETNHVGMVYSVAAFL